MIKIKLKRKLWFYPHRCPDCGKVLVFTEHYDQVRCRKCGKKQQRRNKAVKIIRIVLEEVETVNKEEK